MAFYPACLVNPAVFDTLRKKTELSTFSVNYYDKTVENYASLMTGSLSVVYLLSVRSSWATFLCRIGDEFRAMQRFC